MPCNGRYYIAALTRLLGGASIDYQLEVNYRLTDSLCLVSATHDHGAPFGWDKLYGIYRRQ